MKRILILILCALLLTACTALPAEERSFAVALGLDRQDGRWTAFARIPSYQTEGGYITVMGEGDTLEAALASADAVSPIQLHLGQLRMVVFSAALARSDDFALTVNTLAGRHDLRLDAQTAVTDADMRALMDALSPATGTRLSKSLDLLAETRVEQGTTLPAALSDVIRMGERQSPVLMGMTLTDDGADISGAWPVGDDGRVTQPLSAAETQLLALMLGRLTTGTLSLAEGTVRLTSAEVEIDLAQPILQDASVRILLRCTATPLTEEALSRAVATACLGVLNRLSGMGCDALGLARQAIAHVEDMDEWHELDWANRYRDIVWSVSVGASGPS
ncbi:MAG: hypothetical protein ACI4MG_03200 [Aristaeellaceae bacterium]